VRFAEGVSDCLGTEDSGSFLKKRSPPRAAAKTFWSCGIGGDRKLRTLSSLFKKILAFAGMTGRLEGLLPRLAVAGVAASAVVAMES
jgi:hypothetical protein